MKKRDSTFRDIASVPHLGEKTLSKLKIFMKYNIEI